MQPPHEFVIFVRRKPLPSRRAAFVTLAGHANRRDSVAVVRAAVTDGGAGNADRPPARLRAGLSHGPHRQGASHRAPTRPRPGQRRTCSRRTPLACCYCSRTPPLGAHAAVDDGTEAGRVSLMRGAVRTTSSALTSPCVYSQRRSPTPCLWRKLGGQPRVDAPLARFGCLGRSGALGFRWRRW